MISDRRIGTFWMTKELIDEHPAEARAMLRDVIVLKAEYELWTGCIQYTGIHPDFRELGPSETAPIYTMTVHVKDHVPVHYEWHEGNRRVPEIVPTAVTFKVDRIVALDAVWVAQQLEQRTSNPLTIARCRDLVEKLSKG